MSRDTGGQAFPQHTKRFVSADRENHAIGHYVDEFKGGMTLRDYFAGQALTGLNPFQPNKEGMAHVAKRCYGLADAMIAERGK